MTTPEEAMYLETLKRIAREICDINYCDMTNREKNIADWLRDIKIIRYGDTCNKMN